jgi:NTE family protein
MPEVMTREKEIRYSSRTRAGTAEFTRIQKIRRAAAALLEKLPTDLKVAPEAELLGTVADRKVFNLVHLIYRAMNCEGYSKDYEFSRTSMNEHWKAGYNDACRTLRHPEVLARPGNMEGVLTFDLSQNGRE